MIVPVPKNGPESDGYFYVDNVRQNAYQLVEFEGDYYYIADFHKYLVNKSWYLTANELKAFGLDLPSAYYSFDATGKMILD